MTAAFLGGILLAAAEWFLPAAFLGVALLSGGILLRKYGYCKLLLMAVLGMAVGFLCFSWQYHRYSQKLEVLDGQTVTLQGRVEDIRSTERLRLLVRGSIEGENFQYKNISVYVYPEDGFKVKYGDTISLSSTASAPDLPRNFGETNYRYYCMGKGIYAFFYPKEGEIEILGNSVSLFRPKDVAYTLRAKAHSALSGRTSTTAEGFLRALLTGDKSLLYIETSENLQRAGLSHVVAVSGLHLQIIIGAVMALFGILKIRRRLFSVILYLLLIWFFVLFTGASASVLRAALMLSVFFFADFFRRENDSLTALAFAAFALCAVNPGMLFDIGFQLSCSSTLGILLFAGKFAGYLSFLPRFFRSSLAVSLAAFAGFAPLGAFHFGSISLIGILANLLVCPLLSCIMIGGLLAVIAAPVPYVSDILFFLLDVGIRYVLWVSALCAAAPWAVAHLPKPGMSALFGWLGVMVTLYALTEKKVRRAGWIFALALVLFAIELGGNHLEKQGTSVTFLSVGNGDCALVREKGRTLLFDSGGSNYTDVGEKTVIPYLGREGIAQIDAAFLTHYHTDHGAGFLSLLENGYIGTLFLPAHEDRELKPELATMAMKAGVRVRYLGDGDTVTLDELNVTAFSTGAAGENNGLVYRLDIADTRILFTGDIDKNGERRLVYRGADIDSDILKVPHHGADTSGLPEFTDAVSPETAVISCGENFYGHPAQSVLELYEKRGIPVHRTDTEGTVRIRFFANGKRKIETLR